MSKPHLLRKAMNVAEEKKYISGPCSQGKIFKCLVFVENLSVHQT